MGLRLLLRDPRGRADQWDPCVAENQKIIGTPAEYYDEENPYYLPDAMADRSIEWLHGVRGQDRAQAVLPLLLDGVQPRTAPRGQSVGRQVQGQVRPGLGQASARRPSPAKDGFGVIPADAEASRHQDPAFPAWDDVPEKLQAFYARQMEVYAGFSESTGATTPAV